MIIVVVGTATEVGKTWVAARTIEQLRAAGRTVCARKPAQSFDPSDPAPNDAEVLAAATGEAPETVCPRHRWYEVPMAPPMAARALSRPPIALADLVAACTTPRDDVAAPGRTTADPILVVETAGGVRSPLADDGDAVDLCRALSPALVVLVADAGLGTINAVLLSAAALADLPIVVVLNRYDPAIPLHRANRDWLETRAGLEVVTDPEALAHCILTLT